MSYQILNCGRFVSRGRGRHPQRRLDSSELIFVLQGKLHIFEDEAEYCVGKGEWLILRSGHLHGGTADYRPDLTFFWLHFRADETWLGGIARYGSALCPAELTGYWQSLLIEQSRREPDATVIDLLFQLIFCELRRGSRKEFPEPDAGVTPLVLAARSYLELHYLEKITLQSTAQTLHCSPEYLGRAFLRCEKESFIAALNRRRIAAAAKLLADGALSIKETAQRCGFSDPAYFRRKFRFFTGRSPGEYRRMHADGPRNTE